MGEHRLIGFGDCDAFYSSAEVARRPWLKGLPVGILGNQGACVIARSYSMKAKGVKVGEAIWDAKVKCPNGIYIKRDFRWYETLSKKLLEEVREHFSPRVEYFSIDEFFWDGYAAAKKSYQDTAEAVRAHMMNRVGVPMTVCYARTRTLAKLFADTSKPFGALAVLDRDHEEALLGKIPVREIAGIAGARERRLANLGVSNCLEFKQANGRLIRDHLTVVGHDLWRELNGEPVTPIRPKRIRHKMISRGGSLAGRVIDPFSLFGWLIRNVERLIEELDFHDVRPSTLTIAVNYFEGGSSHGIVELDVPSKRFDVLVEAAKIGLRRAWRPGKYATHMHLIASKLRRRESWQQSLFEPEDGKLEALAEVKRKINRTFGRFTLRSAATLYSNAFYDDPANEFDVCDIRGKYCF